MGGDGLPVPPYRVYNIGGGAPENLLDYVRILQEELVRVTNADSTELEKDNIRAGQSERS